MGRPARESMATAARDAAARSRRRRSFVTALMLFFAAVLLLDGLAGEPGLLSNRRAERQARAEQEALNLQRAQNAQLRDEVRRIKTDPATQEDCARRTLGVIKPGEKLFRVRDVPPAGKTK